MIGAEEREINSHLPLSTRLESLISALTTEHVEIKRQLWIIRMLVWRKDWPDLETTQDRTLWLGRLLERHFFEEESKLLVILTHIWGTGEKLSQDETLVGEFQRHKVILGAFKDLDSSAHSLPESQRWSLIEELERMISSHVKEEEDVLFPLIVTRIHRQNEFPKPESGSRECKPSELDQEREKESIAVGQTLS